MEKEIKVGIHNCFDFVRRDAKTGEVLGEYKAENIILNNFWAKYLSTTSYDCLKYIHFGTGTATPVATDVKLTAWLGYKNAPTFSNAGTVYDFSNYHSDGVVAVKKSIRLEDTEFNGNFISEVGYSSSTSSTTGLLTKALVKDMNGNVVSIEKKSGEVLDIFATFYVKIGASFDNGNIYWGQFPPYSHLCGKLLCYGSVATGSSNTAYYLQGRPQPQQATDNSGAIDSTDMGTCVGTYDVANKKLVLALTNATASSANIQGGVRGININGLLINLPCTNFTQPVLTKEVVGTGDGIKKDFQTAFGYVKNNGTCKVYVNDVEISATIGYDQMCPKTKMVNDLKIIDYKKLDNDGKLTLAPVLGAIYGYSNCWIIVENPSPNIAPIDTVKIGNTTLYGSNDLISWTQVLQKTSSATASVPVESQNYRYWKFESYLTNTMTITEINSSQASNITNIHLASAPAVGDTVAVTYQPDCIAKDAQHVLNNVKVTLSFNEYTPT